MTRRQFFYLPNAPIPVRPFVAPSISDGKLAEDNESPPVESFSPEAYARPFCEFMKDNPTTFHAVNAFAEQLEQRGYQPLSERALWTLERGGKYYCSRNGSSLIAFAVGKSYRSGNGIAIIAGHVDALTVKLKPVSNLSVKSYGFQQEAVAPYANGLGSTWWDRDLSIGGRVLVRDPSSGTVQSKLVKLDWPIAKVPTLAEHFGAPAQGPFNKETQMVPVTGIDNSDLFSSTTTPERSNDGVAIRAGSFASTQLPKLVQTISRQLGITDVNEIVDWELELFDSHPAQLAGLDRDMISAGRLDDKLCCYAAQEALLSSPDDASPGVVKMVGMFDAEEVGSLSRHGANGNFTTTVLARIVEAFSASYGPSVLSQTLANSFFVSSDVCHAVNPNFTNIYLENHALRLNVGVAVWMDPNGHMTTDSVSHAILKRVAQRCGSTLQIFQVRNDSRSGNTIGPMTSSRTGIRAIDAGIPQLSMHSIRATTGALDPGLGVKLFKGLFDYYEEVDKEFLDF